MAISFYKIFGYPTGVGALIVRKSFLELLSGTRPWFAGGSVDIVQVPGTIVTIPEELHERFEVRLWSNFVFPFSKVSFFCRMALLITLPCQ
jgi:selenocysteine lyase/cysteine desulfurase